MFRYSALALESDWDEFGYTDASDIEIESDILELGDEYEPEEPRNALSTRKESVAAAPPTGPVTPPVNGEAVVHSAAITNTNAAIDLRNRESQRGRSGSAAGISTSVAVKPPTTQQEEKAVSAPTKTAAVPNASNSAKNPAITAKARSAAADAPPPRKSPGNEHALPKSSPKREGKSVAKTASSKGTGSSRPAKAVVKPPVKAVVKKSTGTMSTGTKSASKSPASKATRSGDGRTRIANSKGAAKPAPVATKSASQRDSKKAMSKAEGTPKRPVAGKAARPKKASAKRPKAPARTSKATAPARRATAKTVPSKQTAFAKPVAKKAAPAKRKR